MRKMVIDGRVYVAYGPDEITTPVASAPSVRNLRRIMQLELLFGTSDCVGPLGAACRRAAENVHRGGHSPETRRARQRELAGMDGDGRERARRRASLPRDTPGVPDGGLAWESMNAPIKLCELDVEDRRRTESNADAQTGSGGPGELYLTPEEKDKAFLISSIISLGNLVIPMIGANAVRWLRVRGTTLPESYAPPGETEVEMVVRVRGRNVALGAAWLAARAQGLEPEHDSFKRALLKEYWLIVRDPPTIAEKIRRHHYQRLYYARGRSATLDRRDARWGDDLREVLAEFKRIHDGTRPLAPEEAFAGAAHEDMMAALTPRGRESFERKLDGEPATDAADRQRRSRAERKLREAVEAMRANILEM